MWVRPHNLTPVSKKDFEHQLWQISTHQNQPWAIIIQSMSQPLTTCKAKTQDIQTHTLPDPTQSWA